VRDFRPVIALVIGASLTCRLFGHDWIGCPSFVLRAVGEDPRDWSCEEGGRSDRVRYCMFCNAFDRGAPAPQSAYR